MVTGVTTKEFTTIQISTETRDRLFKLAVKDESYEKVVKKLLDEHDQKVIYSKD